MEALLDRKVQPLQDKIVALNNTVEGMANSLTFLNSQYEDLLNKVKNMEEEKKEAAAETLRLKTEVLKLNNEIGSWRTNFDNLEQYSRRDCLEIRGVPVTEREDTTKIISNVGSMIGVEINETDVSISHHLPVPRSSTLNTTNEGLSRRKSKVTFHFVLLKIPSFAHVIGFSFIPNICTIDNKVEAGGDKKFFFFALSGDSNPGILRGCCFLLYLHSLDSMLVYGEIQIPFPKSNGIL